jgi:hypothetical protein
MISLGEIKKYLPQYLSAVSQEELFEELKDFPENIDQRFYSTQLIDHDLIYQGDGIDGLMVSNFPNNEIGYLPAIVLSNTCDINPKNTRYFPARITYAPIFQLEKYKQILIREFVETDRYKIESIYEHIQAIRKQLVTQILFLPKGSKIDNDSIVFLDRLNNYPAEELSIEEIKQKRLFVLSNFGFYLFLIKISIHFTRIREGVDRIIE